jgi:hypothetical protein
MARRHTGKAWQSRHSLRLADATNLRWAAGIACQAQCVAALSGSFWYWFDVSGALHCYASLRTAALEAPSVLATLQTGRTYL